MKRAVILSLLAVWLVQLSAATFEVRDSVLIIPAGVTKIDDYAFQYREDFKRIEFAEPCRVREIGRGAFSWCANLESVKLPRSVVDLNSQAFAYCDKLRAVTFPTRLQHVGANCFSFCKALEAVVLPASVNELESYAFSECVSMRRAVLPANSKLLGELIFSGCRMLERIEINWSVPPEFDCNSTLFENTENFMYGSCMLLVPQKAVERYKSAPGWKLFKEISSIRND